MRIILAALSAFSRLCGFAMKWRRVQSGPVISDDNGRVRFHDGFDYE